MIAKSAVCRRLGHGRDRWQHHRVGQSDCDLDLEPGRVSQHMSHAGPSHISLILRHGHRSEQPLHSLVQIMH
eukprot:2698088-Rhodomonas_salina.2